MKNNRNKLIKKLDKMFSKYIRERAENTCEYCGKSGIKVDCHHGVVHRRFMMTRYEPDNCVCVCVGCHWHLGYFPNQNMEFFRKRIGRDRIEQLEILAKSGKKPDLESLLEKYKEYR